MILPAPAALALLQDVLDEDAVRLVDQTTLPRWLWYLGLFGVIGAVVFRLVAARALRHAGVTETALDRALDARIRRVGLTAGGLALLASLARLFTQVRSFLDPIEPFSMEAAKPILLSTTWGHGWIAQTGLVLLVLVALLLARPQALTGWTLATAAAAALAFAAPLTGHAMAGPWPPLVQVPLQGGHLLAGAAWLGTLFAMLAAGFRASRRLPDETRAATVATMVHVFSPLALAAAGGAMLLGGVLGLAYVGAPAPLFGTTYGRTLLVKVAVLAVVLALGAWNWRRLRPSLGADEASARLQRSATFELAMGALLLAITAVLVALPSPHE